jgi:protein-disulfide isomerase
MLTARLVATLLGSALLNLNLTTCQSPGESDKVPEAKKEAPSRVQLPEVDTKELSPREQSQWSNHVSTLLSPCENTPVSVAVCVGEKKDCKACLPAAEYLVGQVREGKTSSQVERAYKERFSPDAVIEIDVDGSPSKGAPNAPITIVEWADFECPACQAASPTLDEFVKKNPDVRLVFKNFPLDLHENAEMAARASVAADKQGKFWEMHKELFSAQVPLIETTLFDFAKKLGLDLEQFKKDLRSEAVADAVARDRKQGEEAKLRATPTIYINGRLFSYGADLAQGLAEWVELERKLVGAKKKNPAAKTPPPAQEKKPAPADNKKKAP